MQWSRLTSSLQSGILLAGTLLIFSPCSRAVEIVGGNTMVALDSSTVSTLTSLGFTIAGVAPATLTGLTATFPITGGDTTSEIDHSGGLTLTEGGTTAEISSFVIHLDGSQINTITGFLSSGAIGLGGVTFFDIGTGLTLTLDAELANNLSGAFSIPNLTGAPIGVATVNPTLAAAAPEPASLALLGAGLAAFAAYRRRRSSRES